MVVAKVDHGTDDVPLLAGEAREEEVVGEQEGKHREHAIGGGVGGPDAQPCVAEVRVVRLGLESQG